jgi:hypothetical protein
MKLDENDYQLLGFMDLNGPELCNKVGTQYGKSPSCIELKGLTGSYNRYRANLS